jgi:hypothetical protein
MNNSHSCEKETGLSSKDVLAVLEAMRSSTPEKKRQMPRSVFSEAGQTVTARPPKQRKRD